jgi:hypothetical protein
MRVQARQRRRRYEVDPGSFRRPRQSPRHPGEPPRATQGSGRDSPTAVAFERSSRYRSPASPRKGFASHEETITIGLGRSRSNAVGRRCVLHSTELAETTRPFMSAVPSITTELCRHNEPSLSANALIITAIRRWGWPHGCGGWSLTAILVARRARSFPDGQEDIATSMPALPIFCCKATRELLPTDRRQSNRS